jgi:hypothetical protein
VNDSRLDSAYASSRILLARYLEADDDDERRQRIAALRPTRAELEHIFAAPFVDDAADGYRMLWNNAPLWPVDDAGEISVVCARAADLRQPSPTTYGFPGGYKVIASLLQPQPIWCAWRFWHPHRARSSSFDGLVLVDGKWRWCPRPWRVLPEPRPPFPWLWTE